MRLEHPLHTTTDCPGCLHRVVAHRAAKCRDVDLRVHPRSTAGDVEEPRTEGITKASTEGGEPRKLLAHGKRNAGNYPTVARALRRALEVGFDTKHHLISLPVVTELPTTDET